MDGCETDDEIPRINDEIAKVKLIRYQNFKEINYLF